MVLKKKSELETYCQCMYLLSGWLFRNFSVLLMQGAEKMDTLHHFFG